MSVGRRGAAGFAPRPLATLRSPAAGPSLATVWPGLALGCAVALASAATHAAPPPVAADSAQTSAPACARRTAAAARLTQLQDALAGGRFVAYSPTTLQVHDRRVTPADAASIRRDLSTLRPRFDALVTYGAVNGHEHVPAIAQELGYRALVIGIWDPRDAREVNAALEAARRYPKLVVGLSVGNEMLLSNRATADELRTAVAAIRARAPDVPLAISEPFHLYYDGPGRALLGESDFLLPNVHPVFQPWWRKAPDANGAAFVTGVVRELRARYCGPVLVKETGVPTAPAEAGFTPERQASFYRALRAELPSSRVAAFAYFSAFDAPWRVADEQAVPGHHPEEAHWGLYDAERRPTPAALDVPALPKRGRVVESAPASSP